MVSQINLQISLPSDRKSIVDFLKEQLPSLRYGLYIVLPYLFYQDLPKYINHVIPSTNDEKVISFMMFACSIFMIFYSILKKFFYNMNTYLTLIESLIGTGISSIAINVNKISFQVLGFVVGLGLATSMSHLIARFDSLRFQRQKERKMNYRSTLQEKIGFNFSREGIISQKLYGRAIIPLIHPSYEQKQSLSAYLKSKEAIIVEKDDEIVVEYLSKITGWIFQYFTLRKKITEKYVVFLKGLDDLLK